MRKLVLQTMEMRKLILFISFSLALIFTGCKKGKTEFTITGTVTDATFSQALTGATMKLYEVEAGGGSTNLIGSTTIGSDGSYSFTFPRNKVESYIAYVEKNNYFTIDQTIPFSTLTVEEDNVRNLSTTAKSWAKIHLVNSNPQPTDHLSIVKQAGKTSCAECCGDQYEDFYGALDTILYCGNDGNTTYSFYYSVVGTADQGIKSATTVAFDTTLITLSY